MQEDKSMMETWPFPRGNSSSKATFWVAFQMLKHLSLKLNPPLIGGLEHLDYCSIQLGISWSQLTSCPSFFRGVSSNHQPVIVDQALGVWGTVPTVTTEWILPIAQRSPCRQGDTPPMSARGELSRERGSPLTLLSVISKLEYLYIIDYIITIKFSIYKNYIIYIYILYIYMRAIAKAREQVTSRVCAHKRGHCICSDL